MIPLSCHPILQIILEYWSVFFRDPGEENYRTDYTDFTEGSE